MEPGVTFGKCTVKGAFGRDVGYLGGLLDFPSGKWSTQSCFLPFPERSGQVRLGCWGNQGVVDSTVKKEWLNED